MRFPANLGCMLMRFLVYALVVLFISLPIATHAATLQATSGPVVVIALENQGYSDVVGSADMPYYNALISKYGLATQFHANVHGSFPDYAMLTTGEMITSSGGGLPNNFPISINNLVRQMVKKGKSWKVYAENLPSVGYTGSDVYPYVKRHNPFAYMADVIGKSQANNLVPFSHWSTDLAANTLPKFSFVVPNALHDGHDCPTGQTCPNSSKLAAVDQWLNTHIAP